MEIIVDRVSSQELSCTHDGSYEWRMPRSDNQCLHEDAPESNTAQQGTGEGDFRASKV